MIPGMMGDDDKKNVGVDILKEELTPEDNPGLDAAVDELFMAIESKDKSAFKDALKSFMYLCEGSEKAEME